MTIRVPVAPELSQQGIRIPALEIDSTGAFGEGITRGALAATEEFKRIQLEQKQRDDTAKVLDVTATASNAMNEVVSELQQRKMHDAEGATDEAQKRVDKITEDALAATTNETQKEIVKRTLSPSAVAHVNSVRAHQNGEMEAFKQFSADNVIKASAQSAAVDPLNPEMTGLAKLNAAGAAASKIPGATPEQVQAARESAISTVAASQLSSLIAQKRNAEFLAIYPSVKGQLRGEAMEHFAAVAATTTDLQEEQRLSDEIFAKHAKDQLAGLAEAEKLKGTQRDNVTQRLKVKYADVKTAQTQVDQGVIDAAKAAFYDGGFRVAAIPADVKMALKKNNPEVLLGLVSYEELQANREKVIKTDPKTFTDWWYKTDAEKIDTANEPLQYAAKWSESDLQNAVKEKARILNLLGGFKQTGTPPVTSDDINKLIRDEFGKAYDPKSDVGTRRFPEFDGLVRGRVEKYQKDNGGKTPDYEDLKKYVAWALTEGARVDAGMFGMDTHGRRFQSLSHPGEVFKPYVGTAESEDPLNQVGYVPPDIASKIAAQLRGSGVVPTAPMILDVYRRMKK